jgi:DNA-binding Lrp family transcriptional regulator
MKHYKLDNMKEKNNHFDKSYHYINGMIDNKGNKLSSSTIILLQHLITKAELFNKEHKEYEVNKEKSDKKYHFHSNFESICNDLHISRSTVNRQCRVLEESNIIKKYRSTQTTKFWINYELLNKYENGQSNEVREEKTTKENDVLLLNEANMQEIGITDEVKEYTPKIDSNDFVEYIPSKSIVEEVKEEVINTNLNILTYEQLDKLEQKYCQKNNYNKDILKILRGSIKNGYNLYYEVLYDNFFAANINIYYNNVQSSNNLFLDEKLPIVKTDTLNIEQLDQILKDNYCCLYNKTTIDFLKGVYIEGYDIYYQYINDNEHSCYLYTFINNEPHFNMDNKLEYKIKKNPINH